MFQLRKAGPHVQKGSEGWGADIESERNNSIRSFRRLYEKVRFTGENHEVFEANLDDFIDKCNDYDVSDRDRTYLYKISLRHVLGAPAPQGGGDLTNQA